MQLKLILKDGTEFNGESFGYWPKKRRHKLHKKIPDATLNSSHFIQTKIHDSEPAHFVDGEVVFNTGMVGYPESLTDPSYRGQILVLTYPMIGNYGVPSQAMADHVSKFLESDKIQITALIVNEYSPEYSHWQAKSSLAQFLKKHKIPAIQGVDTRALTQKLREHGVMLGKITVPEVKYSKQMAFDNPDLRNLVAEVSGKKRQVLKPKGKPRATVALYDCGAKHNIIRSFLERGVRVLRLPWDFRLEKVKEKYDGVFVSNGPGDPMLADKTIESLQWAMKETKKPIFGICLGTQLMALAAGAQTYKLKYGHRSANQPCTDEKTGRCYITSQNHGFAIKEKSLPKGWKVWFRNANDGTIEGIKHKTKPWLSVQFHPEANPGPEDAAYLFDEFIKKIV